MFSQEKDLEMFTPALQRIAQADPAKIEELLQPGALRRLLGDAFHRVLPSMSARILKDLKADAPTMRRQRRTLFRGFERRLYEAWRKPLDLFEMLIVISAEAAEAFSSRWASTESPDKDRVFDVVRGLHARGCQVAMEILTLLKGGYAAGAHARWRALHETNVTAMFIAKHGRDSAARYLLHEHIEAHKAALGYQKHCQRLRQSPISEQEMADLKATRDQLLVQFGKAFGGSYGWAASALNRTDEGVRFAEIEGDVQLDHWRPYYKMASHPVHANTKALTFNLGLRPRQNLLLTGPSNLGLTDPGHSAALSLMQLTITLICLRPTTDSIVVSHVMMLLVDEMGAEFMKAHKAIEARVGRGSERKAATSRALHADHSPQGARRRGRHS